MTDSEYILKVEPTEFGKIGQWYERKRGAENDSKVFDLLEGRNVHHLR